MKFICLLILVVGTYSKPWYSDSYQPNYGDGYGQYGSGSWNNPSSWNSNQYQQNSGYGYGQYGTLVTGSPWNSNQYAQNSGNSNGQAGSWTSWTPDINLYQNKNCKWEYQTAGSNNNPFTKQADGSYKVTVAEGQSLTLKCV